MLSVWVSAPCRAEQTITCPAGKIDILDWMTLDSDLRTSKHMSGPLYTVLWADKYYWIKTPNGDTQDINLYDSNTVYLWYTELEWHQPYNYRKHSSNYNMPMSPRCATPGFPGSTSYASDTSYTTYLSCTATQVNNVKKAAFSVWGPYTAGHPGLEAWRARLGGSIPDSTPVHVVQYRYNCDKYYGNCASAEEYVLTQRFGLVRWELFASVGGVLQSTLQVNFNTLLDGAISPWVPCLSGFSLGDNASSSGACHGSDEDLDTLPHFDGADPDESLDPRFGGSTRE